MASWENPSTLSPEWLSYQERFITSGISFKATQFRTQYSDPLSIYRSHSHHLTPALLTRSHSFLFQKTNGIKVQGWDFLLGVFDKDWRTLGPLNPGSPGHTQPLVQHPVCRSIAKRTEANISPWGTHWQIVRWVAQCGLPVCERAAEE